VCSSAIAFLLPGAAAFAILYRNSPQQQQKQSSADSTDETSALLHEKSSPVNGYNTGLRQEIFAKVLSAIVFLFGVLVLVAGTSQTIYSIFQ
jgi:hypothetical protein